MRFPIVVTIIFAAISLASPCQAAGSDIAEARTKLEAFQTKTGNVVIKGYTEVGSLRGVGSLEVTAMQFTDVGSGQKQSGVVIEIKESGRLENSDSAFIDYEEIQSLIEGIDYVAKATKELTPLNSFEASYQTKGDFKIVTYSSSSGKVEAAVRSGRIHPATTFIKLEQLTELKQLIIKAKDLLK